MTESGCTSREVRTTNKTSETADSTADSTAHAAERGTEMTTGTPGTGTRDGGRRTEPRRATNRPEQTTPLSGQGQRQGQTTGHAQGQAYAQRESPLAPPASDHWREWIGEAFVQAQYATRNPTTGDVDFPYMRQLADATGIPQDTLRTYVRKGHIPSPEYARALAQALRARGLPVNVLTVLYHAGKVRLDELVPFWSPTFVSLMTEEQYTFQRQGIEQDVVEYLRPMMLRNLEVSWGFSRYVTSVLTFAGLSPQEIAEFIEQMNAAEERDALRAGVLEQPYTQRTPPSPPQDYLRETPHAARHPARRSPHPGSPTTRRP